MFLNLLNQKEKEVFFNLVKAIVEADDVLHDSEIKILEEYKKEMEISISNTEEDIESLIEYLNKNSTLKIKRAIFVELLSLAFCDGEFSSEENKIIEKLSKGFEFDNNISEEVIDLLDSYTSSYRAITNFIEKGE